MVTEQKVKEYVRRLILARMHLLSTNGFFGLLLMHAEFALDDSIMTAATDGDKIYFSPAFMDEISDSELEFVLMHEIMHVAFGHCLRGRSKDPEIFNIACDIVINSNILQSCGGDLKKITLKKYGVSMHLTPDNKEGVDFTAEEVYEMLIRKAGGKKKGKGAIGVGSSNSKDGDWGDCGDVGSSNSKDGGGGDWDDHGKWKEIDETELAKEQREKIAEWNKRIKDACEVIKIREASTGRGTLPLLAERKLKELSEPQLDWREILSAFIQEEVVDYSFSPPDKRYQDSPFFLPDFNDTDFTTIKNVLFMIDTSGSMSDAQITSAYSEIKGAIDQFDGKLQGLLGFFDYDVVKPKPFEDEETFRVIKPKGGGGTSFANVFKYVQDYMKSDLPTCIIILTDGYAPFPDEKESLGVPTLWLINNEHVTPPWGKVARIK